MTPENPVHPPSNVHLLKDLYAALKLDFEEQDAEIDANRNAMAETLLAAMVEHPGEESRGGISRHGVVLGAMTPQTVAMTSASGTLDGAAWERDGFCVLGRVVEEGQLERLGEAATELIDRAFAASGMRSLESWVARITQIPDPADWVGEFRVLEENPVLRAAAAAALGSKDARCAWAHLVFKPPGAARPLPWHTDRPTWPLPEGVEGVAVWMSLDPLFRTSGGLIYAPGTHRPGAPLPDPVAPVVAAGDAILHHADVLHASGANRSGAWRRAWIGVFVAREEYRIPNPAHSPPSRSCTQPTDSSIASS